ncbi:NAD(P)-dependent oxidoreductase [Nocardia farcinica]|uniref:NAD(P)-dependent oxidoreductase n=1 Tax=Nocardia farcinica TaxID=37329 RepID=UPI0024562A89|nr:NAD(P)H-binding protein [Nocardia farcinica]
MKIAVFGATGMVGSAIVDEGRTRGHEVRTVSSRPGAADVTADLTRFEDVAGLAEEVDAIVVSVPPPRTGESHEPWVAAHERLARTPLPTRLVLVGGAGSTLVEGTPLLQTPDFPADYLPEATSAARVLELFRAADAGVDWTILSPAPVIAPGERTGNYRLGGDELVGERVSTQDYAVALWDELEQPKHRRTRFTVAN